jgi:uncharacterized membrane protein (UPF0127 family)
VGKRAKPVVLLSIVFVILLLTVFKTASFPVDPNHRLVVFENGTEVHAEVAQTADARQRGLMFRDRIPEGTGMLFVFSDEAIHRFWTKNCRFSLDIIWLSKRKEVIYIAENIPPCKTDTCPNFGPTEEKALYVIEAPAGFAKKGGIVPRMKAHF